MLRKMLCISALIFVLSIMGWSQNGIQYGNGPIIADPHVYLIWYGNWGGNSATSILPDFFNGLSGSRYFDTNTTYYQSNAQTGQTILNRVTLAGQVFIGAPLGFSLSDGSMASIVNSVLQAGQLPVDGNGIYFVLTSPDVIFDNQVCPTLCGFHRQTSFNLTDIKFAYVGDPPAVCENACGQANSPNGNPGADSMASWIAHELNETVTDPDFSAWFTGSPGFGEVGDKCEAFPLSTTNFGPTNVDGNGQRFNVTLNGRNFLIQQNWVNFNGGFCGLGVGVPPPLNVAFIEQQYLDFLDRAAEPAGLAGWLNSFNNGTSRPAFIQAIVQSQEISTRGKFVEQAYVGLLVRPSDFAGFRGWVGAILNGATQLQVVQGFINSSEFQNFIGSDQSNARFVTVLYQNVLLRAPDASGFNSWVSALNSGSLSRAQVALGFLQSAEFQGLTASQNKVSVGLLYVDMLRRSPDANGFASWVGQLNSGVPLTSVINGFVASGEYAARF